MKKQRPVNLNLFTIRQPIPAIVSILHRITGVLLFLLIPLVLWAFQVSLGSDQGFETIHQYLTSPLAKLIVWGFLVAFLYHFVAGIRHLLMDINIGVSLKGGRRSAFLTLGIVIILTIITGIWIW